MAIPFWKYHGLGNDLIVVEGGERATWGAWAERAPRWCNRRTGIGADGILVVDKGGEGADARMTIINADGSDGGMCGNGIRCVAKFLIEHRGMGANLKIGTARGVLAVRCVVERGEMVSASVDMGEPELGPAKIPVRSLTNEVSIALTGHAAMTAVCVSMGNPHAVIFVSGVDSVPLEAVGRKIQGLTVFPESVNVQFAQVVSPGEVRVRTWERGAGATQACGTGACAVVVAGVLKKVLERNVRVVLPGGELRVGWDAGTNRVTMTGPAEEVFRGEAGDERRGG